MGGGLFSGGRWAKCLPLVTSLLPSSASQVPSVEDVVLSQSVAPWGHDDADL